MDDLPESHDAARSYESGLRPKDRPQRRGRYQLRYLDLQGIEVISITSAQALLYAIPEHRKCRFNQRADVVYPNARYLIPHLLMCYGTGKAIAVDARYKAALGDRRACKTVAERAA